jgi:phosphoglycerate dehydrogenase-like enzyme
MSKPKVLIFAPREEPPETMQALEGLGCEVVVGNRDWQLPRTHYEDDVAEAARDAVALMGTSMRHTPISRRIMQASQRLRVVAKYTVGVDDIDTDAATELGIMVCHAPTESNCFGVAETTVTMMLALLKKLRERDADVRAGKWRTLDNYSYYVGSRVSDGFPGQTIGLVGFGRIGTRVAQLMTPWRARLIAYDPYVQPATFLAHGVRQVDYDTLLRESDVVSFHVVLTKETRYMFGDQQLTSTRHAGRFWTRRRWPRRSTKAACAGPPSMLSRRSRCRWTHPCASSATACCCRRTRLPIRKAASCDRASTGQHARSSPRSRAASRTMSTTKKCCRAGGSASAAPASVRSRDGTRFLLVTSGNSPRPRIVLFLHQQEGSMRKPLSIGAIAASAMLLGSTAIAVAGSESVHARYQQLAQLPTDPPVIAKRSVNLNEEDRHTIREIVLKDRKVQKTPENAKVAIGEAVPQGVNLQPMPDDVTRKVPQLKNNTYFVMGEEVVIVEPKDNTVAEIVK